MEPKVANRSTIESKVGSIKGWEELLACNGFHFISRNTNSSSSKDVQSTIVFPEHDDSGLQKRTHRSIEGLLGEWAWHSLITMVTMLVVMVTTVCSN